MKTSLQAYLNHYRGFAPAVWINIIGVFIATSGLVLNTFFTLFLVNDRGIGLHELGLILATGGLGAVVGSYLSGYLCDRINPAKIAILGLFGFALFVVFFPFTRPVVLLVLLNFTTNLFLAIFRPANFMIIFANCEEADRTRVMAFYRVAYNLGISFGATLGGLLASISFTLLFCFSSVMSVVAIFMMLKYYPLLASKVYRKEVCASGQPFKQLSILTDFSANKAFLMLCLLFLLYNIIFAQVRSTYAIYLNHVYHIGLRDLGLLMLINFLLIVFFEVPMMNVLKNYKLLHLCLYGTLLLGLSYFILPFGTGYFFAAASIFGWTTSEILATSPFLSLAFQYANPQAPAVYVGIFQSISSLAMIVAPSLGTLIYGFHNGDVIWYGSGIITLLMIFGFRYLLKHQHATTAYQHTTS
jgi:predicted MFS family arabinose efflux permease